jgi:hypothetical protein
MQEWKECPSIFKVLKIKMTSNNNSKKHWFALKVFYNKVFAIEELLLKKKIKCYIPCETVKVLKQDGTKKTYENQLSIHCFFSIRKLT